MSTAPSEVLATKVKPAKSVKKTVKTTKMQKSESTDLLAAMAHQVENLTKDEAFQLVDTLLNTKDEYDIRLGGALSAIIKNQWYRKDEDDTTKFDDFILQTYGFRGRKARYLAGIYDDLVEAGIAWSQVEGIGWTKLRIISPVLTSHNVEGWVKRAKTKSRSALIAAVEKAQLGKLEKSGIEPGQGEVKTTVTMSFKVHQDQKETITNAVEKAKKEANTEFPGVALEAICMSYLNSAKKQKAPSLMTFLKQYKANEVVDAVDKIWPDLNFSVDLPEDAAS